MRTCQLRRNPWRTEGEPVGTIFHSRLMTAYDRMRNISTPFGLDQSHHEGWRWDDHHAKTACRAPQEYGCQRKGENRNFKKGQVNLPVLLQQMALFAEDWKNVHTVWLYVDNRSLETQAQLPYWKLFSPWIKERCRWLGPYQELTTAAFIPSTSDFGLHEVHFTWAGT